jgi:hypothetical protein
MKFLYALLMLVATAHAELTPISVPELDFKNLPQTAGSSVSVFYAIGSSATGNPFIRMLSAGPVQADIHADGTASVPATTVPRKGFQIFNYLVMVVHPANVDVTHICNAFGSIPTTQGLSDENCDADYMKSVKTFYRRIQLNADHTKISEIGFNPVDGNSPITINISDMGAPVASSGSAGTNK